MVGWLLGLTSDKSDKKNSSVNLALALTSTCLAFTNALAGRSHQHIRRFFYVPSWGQLNMNIKMYPPGCLTSSNYPIRCAF